MRMFGSSKSTSFPRPPGGVGGGKPPGRGGSGNSNRSGGGGGGGGGGNATKSPPSGGNSGMSAAAAENRIQHCRQAVAQLQEMLRMDYSADLCPMLDILVQEARDEIGHLQSAGEACLAEGRLDLVEQLTTMASDLEEVQRKAEVWKRGGSGGGAAAPNSFMTDDERMARELHAQFQEEERAASNQGTPATTNRSHRSNQEEEDERFARELQAADQGPVPEPAPFPSAGLGGMAAVDEGSDPGRGGRKKDKKKKKDKEDPFGAESFGAPPEAAGAFGGAAGGGGWPGSGPAADVGAGVAGAFQADFGAFPGAAEDKWGDRSPPSFPMSAGGAGDFGAFGGSGGGFPSESKPAAPTFRGADDFPGADSGPGGFPSGNSPHGDFGAFPSADVNLAPPESPMGLPHSASQDSWGHSSVGKHGWGSQAAGETVTMHIQRPYSEIADDIEGFTADFVRDIAKAMGIAQHRIRVQGVRPS